MALDSSRLYPWLARALLRPGCPGKQRFAISVDATVEPVGFEGRLKRQTHRSIVWTIAGAAGNQFFAFVVFLLMARLLPKLALGTYAIGWIFVEIGSVIASAGVTQLVARAKSLDQRQLDTIFWTNIALGALYCLVLFAFAPMAARDFRAPQLDEVLRWLTLSVMLASFGFTHMALRMREFGHRTVAARSLLAGLIGGAAAVIAALLGAGVWSLVLQRLVRDSVGTVLAWRAYPWLPRFDIDLKQAKSNLAFSAELAAADLITLLTLRTQDLMIGRLMSAVALSTYKVAWRCTELLGPSIISPFSTVALQTFSRLQDHREEVASAYLALLRKCAIITVPALVGYGIAGPWLVPSLFGAKWADAGWISPALMLLTLPLLISSFVTTLLWSIGKVSVRRKLAFLELGSTVAITAVTVRYGLLWVALGYSLRANLIMPFYFFVAKRAAGIGVRRHLASIQPSLISACVMSILLLPALVLLNTRNLLFLMPLCAAGAAVYFAIVFMLVPDELGAIRRFLRSSILEWTAKRA